ncbi:MAG: glycosyltransferase [Candidatus Peregrinibacteria bacterium]
MKFLIITQKADRTDPILGFFHRWIEEFTAQTEQVIVIAQQTGVFNFPKNVTVLSLGKEAGKSKLGQILRFWILIWKHRKSYDRVLVHMTPIWVVLGWKIWFLLRKPVYLWYEIRRGSLKLSFALFVVRKVFSASKEGLPQPSRKQVVTGHGIDTDFFSPSEKTRDPHRIIAIGRITRSKRYDVILRTFAALPSHFKLEIAGGTITASDITELQNLQTLIQELHITNRVSIRWVSPAQMPEFLQSASLLLHACIGGLDKVLLEAMACGVPVVSCSEAAKEELPELCAATPETMIAKAQSLLMMSEEKREKLGKELRQNVIEKHGLVRLIGRMVEEMES